MSIEIPSEPPAKWLGLPIIATISRLLCQELTLQNEYLRLENKILKLEQKGNDTIPVSNDKHLQPSDIQCQQFLGGLLKSYFRKAA